MSNSARRTSTLYRRIVWGLVALSIVIASLAGVGIWASDVFIEDAAVRDLMERELSFMTGPHAPAAPSGTHDALRFFDRDTVPEGLRIFGAGYYEDLDIDERSFNLLVRDTGDGKAYLLYDISFVEAREYVLSWSIFVALIAVGVMSYIIARWIADRALAPLDHLVGQLEALDPERRGERIELQFRDSELDVIAAAINRYMVELDALIERERAFATAASHELRTPIAVIQGAAETLALQGEKPALKRIERAVTMARHELDALLALSRVHESPPSRLLALQQWLPELAEPYRGAAPQATLEWDLPQPVTLGAPPGAVAAIFTNLLRNALRAAPRGRVVVRLRNDRIIVEDDGPGIPPEKRDELFSRGARLDTTGKPGTGLGLAIVRDVAEIYGGKVSLGESEDLGGVLARLTLPAG